jgi:hypothetical protein
VTRFAATSDTEITFPTTDIRSEYTRLVDSMKRTLSAVTLSVTYFPDFLLGVVSVAVYKGPLSAAISIVRAIQSFLSSLRRMGRGQSSMESRLIAA